MEALLITVAALFPEDAGAQQRDSAVTFLRTLVRLSPDVTIPSLLAWPGLDSLLEDTRRRTFAVFARPRRANMLEASSASIPIAVVATRPARFVLSVGSGNLGRRQLVLDSSGPAREASLALRLFADDHPLVPTGDWILSVTATDSVSGDTIVQRFPMTVSAPALELVAVPGALDSSQLRSEWARPSRGLGVAIGAGLGGLTVLLAQAIRAPEPVNAAAGTDRRALLVGLAFGLGGGAGALLDRGRPLLANVAHNDQLRAAFAERVSTAEAENARRRAEYRASVTIGEAQP